MQSQTDIAPFANEPERSSLVKTAMTYGIYYGCISVGLSLLLYFTGNTTAKWAQWAGFAVMLAAVIWIQTSYRKANGGFLSYGQGLGISMMSLLFASVLMAVYTYLVFTLDAGLLAQLSLMYEETLVNQGMNEDHIEKMIALMSRLQTPGFMAISAVFNLLLTGLIIAAVTSIFIRKKSPSSIFD